jgi:hypothetical protein
MIRDWQHNFERSKSAVLVRATGGVAYLPNRIMGSP